MKLARVERTGLAGPEARLVALDLQRLAATADRCPSTTIPRTDLSMIRTWCIAM